MTAGTPHFRIRWLLRAKAQLALHPRQNAILYALLCDAARGQTPDGPSHMPEGLLLDAPETGRLTVDGGEHFAFGATLIEADPAQATRRLHRLSLGLMRLGNTVPKVPVALGGNFDLIEVRDLVSGLPRSPDDPFQPVSRSGLTQQIERLLARADKPLTLRFLSPLRLELPGDSAIDGHRFADGGKLIVGQLLRAVQKRLPAAGLIPVGNETPFDDSAIELIENRLTWLDLEYGQRDHRKSLGGALGRICVLVKNPLALAALVLGQYTRVGRNLRFGFGAYRIEELGPDPTQCERAMATPKEQFDSACEVLFETSSFARNSGLSWKMAPHRLANLRREGWVAGRAADFEPIVATLPSRLVRDRLEVWLGDDAAAEAVRSGPSSWARIWPLLDLIMAGIHRSGAQLARNGREFVTFNRRVP